MRCRHAHCLRCASRQASINQYSRLTTVASLCVCVCLVCVQAQAAVDLADSELQQGRMEREHLKLEVRRLLLCLLLCQSLLPSSCFSLCMSCVLATSDETALTLPPCANNPPSLEGQANSRMLAMCAIRQ